MTIHPSAAVGFASAAEVYERARPSYPQDAIDWLVEQTGLGSASTVVDLGAGTGKLTRLLLPTGARSRTAFREPFAFPYKTEVHGIPRSSDRDESERGTSIKG